MPEVIDLFLIGGQSNTEGTGDPDSAPTVPAGAGYEYVPGDDALVHLEEPVGEDDGAASWAVFARKYYDLTGRPIVVVPTAVGGSAQHADADGGNGHWDDGGELRSGAITAVRRCRRHLDREGITYEFRGVLWHQGETEAMQIDASVVSIEQYERAFGRMVRTFRDTFDEPALDVFLFQIGRHRDEDTEGWRAVRAAQERFADEGVHLVFEDAVTFADSGNMQDVVHYDQGGYNRMGREGAGRIAAIVTHGDGLTTAGRSTLVRLSADPPNGSSTGTLNISVSDISDDERRQQAERPLRLLGLAPRNGAGMCRQRRRPTAELRSVRERGDTVRERLFQRASVRSEPGVARDGALPDRARRRHERFPVADQRPVRRRGVPRGRLPDGVRRQVAPRRRAAEQVHAARTAPSGLR